METRDAARRWVDAWVSGWRTLDPEPIAAVYADDCFFLSHPFREPQAPREFVERAFAEEESPEPWFGEPLVDGDRAAVEWHAYVREKGRDMTLAGTSLLRFAADGLCIEQRDAWAVEEGRVERR